MARRRKPARPDLDKPGLPPLLRGHLSSGGMRPGDGTTPHDGTTSGTSASAETAVASTASPEQSAQPATRTVEPGADAAIRGKATKSPEDVATRPHLEGAEQGPS